jgi:pimeloyl-ACP methyl ester carboxylesterase
MVVAVSGGMVTLREKKGADQDYELRAGNADGLDWAAGSGELGPVTSTSGGSVVRSLKVTSGAAPVAGDPAGLRRDVYDDPKQAYDVAFDEVDVTCAGGHCPAWSVPGQRTDTWAVMVHGKGASRTEALRALGPVIDAKLSALVISYRNDEGVPADESDEYGYGVTEWRDLDGAVSYALEHGAQRVLLYGASMGGGIVASFLQHSANAGKVSGVVLDAPMLDLARTITYGASLRTLPLIGTSIPGSLITTARRLTSARYGVDWDHADYLDGPRWLQVPALVLHGTADRTVPIATSEAFAASYPDLVRFVRFDGATHVGSWNRDVARYRSELTAFLTRVAPAP